MLRIGRIEYANCTPIFRALQQNEPCDDYMFVGGVPAQLNALLAEGRIDVCPSSSIEYALHPDQYLILPQLSISCAGAVGSVLLFSRVPLEYLDCRNILLSSESATSVNLLKILLEKRYGYSCTYSVHTSSVDDALREAPAILLIGDSALRASLLKTDYLVYDLGQMWHEWTGLPFVFALWLCRRQVVDDCYSSVADLAIRLVESKKYAGENLQSIADEAPEALWMGADKLVDYWRDNISYDLNDRHLEGLTLFYQYCAELELLTTKPTLHFFVNYPQKEI